MTRIYIVKRTPFAEADTGETLLVRAANANQALRFVADKTITATVATQDELIAATLAGIKPVDAG